MHPSLRLGLATVAVALLGWFGIEIARVGGDVPIQVANTDAKFRLGHAEGRRSDGTPAWSLDYAKMSASPDTTQATLDDVSHGELFKHGKPFMQITAKHVIVNTVSNDFSVQGPIELVENDGLHARHFTSVDAEYLGFPQLLTLKNSAEITSDGIRLKVRHVSIDFHSGDVQLGPMVARY